MRRTASTPQVIMTIAGNTTTGLNTVDSRSAGALAGPHAELPRTSQSPFAPCEKVATMQVAPSADDPFISGLRNIRQAIESRLKACGIEKLSLGDTSKACTRSIPGMVIIDVRSDGRMARVTFTRDEVEDCCRCVETYCVRAKINHVVDDLLSKSHATAGLAP